MGDHKSYSKPHKIFYKNIVIMNSC